MTYQSGPMIGVRLPCWQTQCIDDVSVCALTPGPITLLPPGSLPVTELRLDSYVYKQQPTLSRSSFSHVDNEGVKALVDSICGRWGSGSTGEGFWGQGRGMEGRGQQERDGRL